VAKEGIVSNGKLRVEKAFNCDAACISLINHRDEILCSREKENFLLFNKHGKKISQFTGKSAFKSLFILVIFSRLFSIIS
jgi:hypothetical protein